jgi:hypothetical protein
MRRSIQPAVLSIFIALSLLISPVRSYVQAAGPADKVNAPAVPSAPAFGQPQNAPGATPDWLASVQEELKKQEYQVSWQENTGLPGGQSAYQAPNRMQEVRTYFTKQGIQMLPRQGGEGWRWGLRVMGYGWYTGQVYPAAEGQPQVEGARVSYPRGALNEWYVNSESGLEQGFTLMYPPAGQGEEVVIRMALSGSLQAALLDGRTLILSQNGQNKLQYGGLMANAADGRELPCRLELEGQTLKLVVVVSGASYPVTIDPLVSGTPDLVLEGFPVENNFGSSVSGAGDVNGDGYSDVIIGASTFDHGEAVEGGAFIFYGGPNGLSTTYAVLLESNQPYACMGMSVSGAGDVNKDGYDDVVVGATDYNNGEAHEGAFFVYLGSASGLTPIYAARLESDMAYAYMGGSVSDAGDLNQDGYADIIIGAYNYGAISQFSEGEGAFFVYYGGPQGISSDNFLRVIGTGDQAYSSFGMSVSGAGDVNGDGFDDVIVGAFGYDLYHPCDGAAYVYYGSLSGIDENYDVALKADQASAGFGHSVSDAGDVNGDGYGDVIVGAESYDNGQNAEGAVFVYHGGPAGLSPVYAARLESNIVNAELGTSVANAGDVNGDGYSDVIAGAAFYSNGQHFEGAAFVFYGGPQGVKSPYTFMMESNQAEAWAGWSVSGAGDVNGDGYSDILIGAQTYYVPGGNEGRVFVYYGGADKVSTTPALMTESNQEMAGLGGNAASIGDVNGDGYEDVAFTAGRYDNGQTDEGAVFIYHGGPDGLNSVYTTLLEGNQAGAYMMKVKGAGDVNGDGYSDVIVGAFGYDHGETDEGAAFIYYGSSAGINPADFSLLEGNQNTAYFGNSVSGAGDVNGDGYSDVIVGAFSYDHGEINEGAAFVYLGGPAGINPIYNSMLESNQVSASFGAIVSNAGDVNGDGYSDVLVGAEGYQNGQFAEGAVYIYLGGPSGINTNNSTLLEGNQMAALYGMSVSTAGDVNGDGFSDVVVGTSYYDGGGKEDAGAVFVYYGSAAGIQTSGFTQINGNVVRAFLGTRVSSAGDVNGDGYSDIVASAALSEETTDPDSAVYIYLGGASGVNTSPAVTLKNNQPRSYFGVNVGSGDVNGDGYNDILVGAVRYSNGQFYEGAAYQYYGNGGDGLEILPRQMRLDGTPIVPGGVSDSRTAFQIRLKGHSPAGQEQVRMEWQVAPLGVLFEAPSGVVNGVSDWVDAAGSGVEISQVVSGLTPGTPYHWRARLQYQQGSLTRQAHSRWMHLPGLGWQEASLRTLGVKPRAKAGADQQVDTLALVVLDGGGSDALEGRQPLTYQWTQTGGPAVVLSDTAAAKPTFTAPADPAVLTFGLMVVDNTGAAAPFADSVTVTVNNQRPAAEAGANQSVDTLTTVILEGSGSDPDGDTPLTYQWTQISGPAVLLSDAAAAKPSFTAPADPVTLTFSLLVMDSLGLAAQSADLVTVTVNNQRPAAEAGANQSVDTLTTVVLEGSGSDPDGDTPLTYQWTQTSGPAVSLSDAAAAQPSFTAPADPAVLTFSLRVTDSLGLAAQNTDPVSVTVNNQRPAARAGIDQNVEGLARVTLDGTGSSDPDGDTPLTYQWTQTGGPAVTLSDTASAMPSFTAPALHTTLSFNLRVTDSLGANSLLADEVQVTINDLAPVAKVGQDQTVTRLALVTLDGSASSDPEGDLPLSFQWVQTGGPAVRLDNPHSARPVFTAPGYAAELTFSLRVTDSLGQVSANPARVLVRVLGGHFVCLPLTGP